MWDPAIVAAFVEQYRADKQNGHAPSLAEYQARFPGFEGLIASEYADLQRQESRGEAAQGSERWVGPFKVLKELGRGGQGEVYLAEDPRLNRNVALKVLSGFGAHVDEVLSRFKREAEITSRLEDPGICPVYESGVVNGVAYIAMRYIEGETLGCRIATTKKRLSSKTEETVSEESDRPVSPSEEEHRDGERPGLDEILEAVRIIENTARILHAAHEAGIIHRDVKPSNVMVTPPGNPVLLDFGLARDESGALPSLTLSGECFGTPSYMSPEQLVAHRIRLDRRTDVWSLGVMLFECVTLQRPFEAPTREGLYQAILTQEPSDPRQLNREVPTDLRVVLQTALDKDRDRRYQTALDLAEELRRVRMREPILAKPVGPLMRLQRWTQRNPALATAVGGLFAALAAGLVVALFLLGQRDRALTEVTTQRNDKETARSTLAASVADYDRLGDVSRLQRLQAEADKLWPCEPSKLAAMQAWVEQGADLEKRLPGHRDVLGRLRTSAGLLPYTAADRAEDLAAHAPDQVQLGMLREQREALADALAAAESRSIPTSVPASSATSQSSPDEIRASVAKLDATIARLDAKIDERLTWKFASTSEQFKQDTTAKLVADLTAFVDTHPKKGLLSDLRARLSFTESVERETIGKYETRWADAIQSIADKDECPKYGGLRISKQLGLIPIAKDQASGLWEFAHLQTAAPGTDPIPKRDNEGKLIVTESTGLVFVLIPGGSFKMGATKARDKHTTPSDPNVDPEAEVQESPVTQVALDPFFMSKYEMTQGQWLRLVGKNRSNYAPGAHFGGKFVDLRNPVEQVSWEDCDLWLGRLGLVLPTEAQWEYAARGGTTTPRWTGIGTAGLSKAANLADQFAKHNGAPDNLKYESWNDGYTVHAPVGSLLANPFGLHDVLGNVWEWCRDSYGGYDTAADRGDGLRRQPASRARMLRGGSFINEASNARSAHREHYTSEGHDSYLGVRAARRLDNP